jgi:DNA (cytosine-5)-methyltransferase 1
MSQQRGAPCIPGKKRRGRAKATAIDLFAGAGGFSTGAEQAGAHVLFCINHYGPAVAAHALNHPHSTHCHEDVFKFDWNRAPLAEIVLASPSCKCHSTAATKGGKGKRCAAPKHDALRATPWAVVNCVENQLDRGNRPIVVVENVVEFKRRWKLYPGWLNLFRGMGYSVSENILCSLDFGIPQRRTRLFLIFTPTEKAFDLRAPKSRSCPRSVAGLKRGDKIPMRPLIHRGAGDPPEQWSLIEEWDPVSVGRKARQREARLKKRLGRVPKLWYWANTDTAPLSADEPCGTITAESGNQLYIVKGDRMRRWSVHELRGAMGFPKDYLLPSSLPEAGRLLGNAVVPQISKFIVQQLIARA